MKNVTDRTRDPFGLSPPCETACDGAAAVFGYGDANADFHVIGDYPGVHGGRETGVPFTGTTAGRRLQGVLHEVGFLEAAYADRPSVSNLFFSYLHMCCTPGDGPPTETDYARLEGSFDAELRAITAHVLLPVGRRPIEHVFRTYTNRRPDGVDPAAVHATEVSGQGFLVVPVRDPADWTGDDRERIRDRLATLLSSDYRQISDLGRFGPDDEPYYVR